MSIRVAKIHRSTNETNISINLNLDGTGKLYSNGNIAFLDHMLNQVTQYSLIDLKIEVNGDINIDDHHTVEDIGITFGQALSKALGNKNGICRYGYAYVPLDEALSRVVIDCSGRPLLEFNVNFKRARVGSFDVDLVVEFFRGFCNHAGITMHIDNLRGVNVHHQVETIFKAFGLALHMATAINFNSTNNTNISIPSTKGIL